MSTAPPVSERTAVGTPYDPGSARSVLMVLTGMALMVTYVETMVVPGFENFYTFYQGVPYTTIAWILSAYLLVGTVSTPIFGKLGDRYGKKRMLLLVMGVYAVAVSVAGFTPNIGDSFGMRRGQEIYLLIAARSLQGVGMAMFPLAFAMIPEVFPAARVGTSQGIISAMFGAGAALGLVGGGYVTETFGWQDTFHTIIPLAFLLVILAFLVLRESPGRTQQPLDLGGVASLGLGLATLLLALTEGTNWGWADWRAVSMGPLFWGVPEFFALAGISLVLFVWWESRVGAPMVSLAALRKRNIWVANVAGLLVGLTQMLFFVTFVILVEDPLAPGLGLTAFRMGLLGLPSVAAMLVSGPLWGWAASRLGPKPVTVAGFGLMTVGALALAADHGTALVLVVVSVPLLVGMVAVLIATTNVIVLTSNREELGVQTGINQTFRNLGSAAGPVAATAIIASYETTHWIPVAPGRFAGVSAPSDTGFVVAVLLAAAFSLAGTLLSLSLRNFRHRVAPQGASPGSGSTAEGADAPGTGGAP